jgi:amidase
MLIPSDPVNAFVDYPDVPVPNAPSGPLAGVTFAVKDIFDVAGYPTGCGNPEKTAAAKPAAASAPAVQKLLDAGARFVGKTQTVELAFSLDGRNIHYGTPINPAAPGRVPGGSSSGSAAAVAAGLVDTALGSDTGGSVRGPASMCGVIGLRPTHGRIDISATMPLAASLDTVGWFTRDIALYERIGAVMLGPDREGPPLSRLLHADDCFAALMSEQEATALSPAVQRVRSLLPGGETVTVAPDGLAGWAQVFRTVQGYEAWKAHGAWITSVKPKLMPAIAGRFEAASKVTDADYAEAGEKRAGIRERVTGLLGEDGVIMLPTLPAIAPKLDDDEAIFEAFRGRALSILCIAGLSGLPQISMPLAMVDGCPLGLSLIAPAGRDRALIALARRVMEG